MVFAICRSSPPHPAPGWTLEMRFTFEGCTLRRLGILTGPATASLGALLPAGAWRLFIVGHKVDCPSCSAPGGGPRGCSQGSSQCETQAGRRRKEVPWEMPPGNGDAPRERRSPPGTEMSPGNGDLPRTEMRGLPTQWIGNFLATGCTDICRVESGSPNSSWLASRGRIASVRACRPAEICAAECGM
jgi:hypothetical protein